METRVEEVVIDDRRVVAVRPIEQGPWPGVLMLHEIFGIDDVLLRHAQRLASAGYVVSVPDLLGDGAWLRCVQATFRAYRARAGKPFELIESSRQQLQAHPACTGRVGVIGFCFGGGFALLLAADGFHQARSTTERSQTTSMTSPRACPIVASYGGRDRMAKDVPALQAALEAHSVPHDVKVYPSAGHTFLNDEVNGPSWFRPVGRRLQRFTHVGPEPVAAADAWRRIEAFFAQHLGPGST